MCLLIEFGVKTLLRYSDLSRIQWNDIIGKDDYQMGWNELADLYRADDIEVIELEEDVDINFDTTQYLPENFNPLAGKNDIDWSKIEINKYEIPKKIYFLPQLNKTESGKIIRSIA